MYQGKFDKKHRNSTVSTHELVSARNEAQQQKQPARQAQQPARKAPAQKQPVQKQAAAPRKQAAPQTAPERKGPRLGGVIFYTLYFLFIFLFFVGTFIGLNWLHGWLTDYEAAQPTVKCEEVFHLLFDDPDWGALYDAAGITDTEYEGKAEYVAYMENLVGDTQLTYQETSAGLSGAKKYFVRLGDNKLASFMLVPDGDVTDPTNIVNWNLGEIELFFERQEGYSIQLVDGHTAYVNGVPLGDEFIVQKTISQSGDNDFLPAGVSSSSSVNILQIDGLMAMPTVEILDASGNMMPMFYDELGGMFVEQTETTTISEEEKTLVFNALKTYAEYQIKEATIAEVAKYFDSNGDAYKNIMKTVLTWTKGNNGHSFDNDTVANYTRYSDTLFSVYASTELTIKLTDGGVTEKPINATLLFSYQNGAWKVIKMTNADIAEMVTKVRLTFMNDDQVLSSDFYANDTTMLTSPLMTAPEGKVFAGWVREVTDDAGNAAWQLIFTPDENGIINIPSGTVLEPMTLYALYQNA